MPVLRINQQRGDAPHRYRIEITATDIPNFAPLPRNSRARTSPWNVRSFAALPAISNAALDRLQAKMRGSGFTVVPVSINHRGCDVVARFYRELGLTSSASMSTDRQT